MFRITMDDGSSQVVPDAHRLTCSITHGPATEWVQLSVKALRPYVRRSSNGPCLLPPGQDLRHSIASIEPEPA